MRKDTLVILAVLGVGGYLLWKILSEAKHLTDTATDATSTVIANLWLKLWPLPPSIELLGNVKFGNVLVPIQQLSDAGAIRQDRDTGDVYVKYSGYVWQLAPQVNGNWPATRVDQQGA